MSGIDPGLLPHGRRRIYGRQRGHQAFYPHSRSRHHRHTNRKAHDSQLEAQHIGREDEDADIEDNYDEPLQISPPRPDPTTIAFGGYAVHAADAGSSKKRKRHSDTHDSDTGELAAVDQRGHRHRQRHRGRKKQRGKRGVVFHRRFGWQARGQPSFEDAAGAGYAADDEEGVLAGGRGRGSGRGRGRGRWRGGRSGRRRGGRGGARNMDGNRQQWRDEGGVVVMGGYRDRDNDVEMGGYAVPTQSRGLHDYY